MTSLAFVAAIMAVLTASLLGLWYSRAGLYRTLGTLQETYRSEAAGLGGLTIPIARAVARIFALETDARLIGLLKTELLTHNIQNADILHQDFIV